MARVSGMRSDTSDPSPGRLAMSMEPRRPSMVRLPTSMPTPRPDRLVTAAAVEKPGWKMNLWTCASDMRSRSITTSSLSRRPCRLDWILVARDSVFASSYGVGAMYYARRLKFCQSA